LQGFLDGGTRLAGKAGDLRRSESSCAKYYLSFTRIIALAQSLLSLGYEER
jgi:hypothetical protein